MRRAGERSQAAPGSGAGVARGGLVPWWVLLPGPPLPLTSNKVARRSCCLAIHRLAQAVNEYIGKHRSEDRSLGHYAINLSPGCELAIYFYPLSYVLTCFNP